MRRPARIAAAALFGLTLTATLPHASAQGCETCGKSNVPVVHEPRGLLGRLFGRSRVTIPAGHYRGDAGLTTPGPVAHWDTDHDGPPGLGHDHGIDGSGHAVVGNGAGSYGGPGYGYGSGAGSYGGHGHGHGSYADPLPAAEPGAPAPLGVMRTNYAPTPTPATPPAAEAPAPAYDPAVRRWHAYGLGEEARRGPIKRLMDMSGISRFVEKQRMRRTYRWARRRGMVNPAMTQVPNGDVFGR